MHFVNNGTRYGYGHKSSQIVYRSYATNHRDLWCEIDVVYFDTDSYALPEPANYLHSFAGLLATNPPEFPEWFLEAYARADRSGSDRHNIALTRRRLKAVQQALVSNGAPAEKVYTHLCKALGERFDDFLGYPDKGHYEYSRGVWLFLWPSDAAFQEGPDGFLGRLTTFGRSFPSVL